MNTQIILHILHHVNKRTGLQSQSQWNSPNSERAGKDVVCLYIYIDIYVLYIVYMRVLYVLIKEGEKQSWPV